MNLTDIVQTTSALAAITMILIGASWLKVWLRSLPGSFSEDTYE